MHPHTKVLTTVQTCPVPTVPLPRSDVLYLKVRQNTYRAALLASRAASGAVQGHLEDMLRAQTSVETEPLLVQP